MMLWLLATLPVVTTLWGIAHRLKAVNPAANAPTSGARVAPRTERDPRTAVCTDTEERSANPRTGRTPVENPEFRHNMHKENNA
jgi:hypothetical protein